MVIKKGRYNVGVDESENLQRISVDKCLNVDFAAIIGVPEIAGLGCESDIAGYAPEAIGSHRPQTALHFVRGIRVMFGIILTEI